MKNDRIISRREVESLIADDKVIVIFEGNALKLDDWLDKHPGGRLSILHMVGTDATNEINAYHFAKTLLRMKAYRIGKVELPWSNFVPPLRGGTFRKHGDESLPQPATSEDNGHADFFSTLAIDAKTPMLEKPKSTSPLETPKKIDESKCHNKEVRQRVPSPARLEAMKEPLLQEVHVPCPEKISRAEYIQRLEEKEIQDGIRNYPSLDQKTQQAITDEFQALHERIKTEGFYECRYIEYGKEAIRYCFLFAIFLYLLKIKWYLTSACFLGLFWQQIMFTAHDAGHRGITGNFVADTLIGAFIADFCCGLSIGWWKSSHNVHHLVTNMPEHDPDLQNVPLFATGPSYFKSVYSSFYKFRFVWDAAADKLAPYQKYTYYPVMAIARFNLYLLSWLHLLSPRAVQLGSAWWTRHVELVFMACYWYLFGYRLLWCYLPTWPIAIAFVLISHTITMLLHVQITLSHWGMPTSDLGPTESFPQRQLRTTMDINCPKWLDFLHGGLQFQVIHHLFPRVPRHNLRALQPHVREFCVKTKIKYQCYQFIEGNGVVLSRLEEVAAMIGTLTQCHNYMVETGESGLH